MISASQSPLGNHTKVVIFSEHRQAVFEYALAFIDRAEPTPQGGLAKAYRNRRGELLETLQELVEAVTDGELMTEETPLLLAA